IFYIKNFPIKVLIFASLLLIIFMNTMWSGIRKKWDRANLVYKISIGFNGIIIHLDALLDTGNSLYDPISGNPVIIVEYSKIKGALPQEIRDIFIQNNDKDLGYIGDIIGETVLVERFRLIPFYAIDKPWGMLIGFKCDEVLIYKDKQWCENSNIIIAIYNDRLSRDEQYHALIHPEILYA
ncbi:MAG TPA: sigma-E processing peptidase SpoIIGA, partial [Clostridia bacterium]|nr:sigma-E processing peptidase SpoIIGA [Clostridia bacterium]